MRGVEKCVMGREGDERSGEVCEGEGGRDRHVDWCEIIHLISPQSVSM